VRVYGDCPEIRLAYFGPIDQAAGRALVRIDTKKYGRCYGDIATMRALLVQAGYTDGGLGALKGCRIRAIEEGSSWVMPYIDGIEGASYKGGDYIHLDNRGPIATQETNGLASRDADDDDDDEEYRCSHCNVRIGEDENLCSGCQDLEFLCDHCDGAFFSDETRRHDGEQHTYCDDCSDQLSEECELCDRTWIEDDHFDRAERAERIALRVQHLCDTCAANSQGCANDECRGREIVNPAYISDAHTSEPPCLITGYFDIDLDRCPDCQTVVRCEKTAPLVFVDDVSAAADAMVEAIATEPRPRYFRMRSTDADLSATIWRWHPVFGTSYHSLIATTFGASQFDPDDLAIGGVYEEISEDVALAMASQYGRSAAYLRMDHRVMAPAATLMRTTAVTPVTPEEMAF
jgi:hypothetical protein